MRTAQDVFDIAIRLMDEQNESTGGTDTTDTKEYRLRTPSLLNSILNWVYPVSDTYQAREDGRRPVHPAVTAMTDELDLDDYVALSVLPYGLASRLLDESSGLKDYFEQTFLERLEAARQSLPTTIGEVEDVYGGLEHGEFAQWS